MTANEFKQLRLSLTCANEPLSQRQFARLFGISKSAVAAYEVNVRPVPAYIQQSIVFFKQLSQQQITILIDSAVNSRD